MALTDEWDRATRRFKELDERFERIRPTVAAMLRVVAALREDPRLTGVAPSVSLASLNLKRSGSRRYVVVEWDESEPEGFGVSFVDPPLEFSEATRVPEAKVVATVIEYLERL